MNFMGILSETLLILRKKTGLTQDEIAQKLGIPRTYYNSMERGLKPIGKDKLEKIVQIPEINTLGITYGMLYGLKLADMADLGTDDVKKYLVSALLSKSTEDLLKKESPHLLELQ